MAVLALDVGTSSARAALYDAAGTAVSGRFQRVAYEPRLTRDGGVEHDAARLLEIVDVIEPDRARHARYREALAAPARLDAALAARREPPAV